LFGEINEACKRIAKNLQRKIKTDIYKIKKRC